MCHSASMTYHTGVCWLVCSGAVGYHCSGNELCSNQIATKPLLEPMLTCCQGRKREERTEQILFPSLLDNSICTKRKHPDLLQATMWWNLTKASCNEDQWWRNSTVTEMISVNNASNTGVINQNPYLTTGIRYKRCFIQRKITEITILWLVYYVN